MVTFERDPAQPNKFLTGGESEDMAPVRGGITGLGAKAMAEDLGEKFGLDLVTDSSAATGVATRRGVENVRHHHIPLLWLQRLVTDRGLRVWKVIGSDSEAERRRVGSNLVSETALKVAVNC